MGSAWTTCMKRAIRGTMFLESCQIAIMHSAYSASRPGGKWEIMVQMSSSEFINSVNGLSRACCGYGFIVWRCSSGAAQCAEWNLLSMYQAKTGWKDKQRNGWLLNSKRNAGLFVLVYFNENVLWPFPSLTLVECHRSQLMLVGCLQVKVLMLFQWIR